MRKRSKNLLALLLAALMTLTMLPLTALAAPAERREEDASGRFVYVNPFYRRTHTDAELEASAAQLTASVLPTRSAPYYSSFSAAAAYVRSQMLARNTSFSLVIPDGMSHPYDSDVTDALVEEAMAHTAGGDPQAGDSLRWQIGYCYCTSADYSDGKFTLTYAAMYYSTAAQETTLTSEVNSALASLSLSGKTEEQKIRAIYDFICDRVNYDYDHLGDSDYNLQYTAYAAMHLRTAVCQGYAVLFYRMCMEAGLDVRVVTSYDHAWNIVRIGSLYYNVDATWDGGDDTTYHDWYLKGMREFPDHFREEPYNQEDFERAYPMVRDPDLNVANPLTTLPGVDGTNVSVKASGKPKLVVFGMASDGRSVSTMQTLADCGRSSLDVVYADCCDDFTDYEVAAQLEYAGKAGIPLCWNRSSACSDALWQVLDACGQSGDVYVPVVVYIDAGNVIQNYSIGPITDYMLLKYVKDYLGVTLSAGVPRVTTQPEDTGVFPGETAFFHVWGQGPGEIRYQWYWRAGPKGTWAKCTSSVADSAYFYVSSPTADMDGWQYRCMVYNENGYVYSNVVTLTVYGDPVVTKQPADRTAAVGATAKFTVRATGVGLGYQWQYKAADGTNWLNCSMEGNQTETLSVPVTAARNGYQYRCVIEDMRGTRVWSDAATLYVKTTITTQPADKSAAVGATAKFTVKATGAGLTYQWQYRTPTGTGWLKCSLDGNQTKTLSVPVTAGRNGYKYRCVITDANGKKAYSTGAVLTVKTTITSQPADKSAAIGATAKFTVKATGAGLTYQWQYRTPTGTGWLKCSMDGNQTKTLSVPVTAGRNGYQYRCVITDANGKKAYSTGAVLTVKTTITSQPADQSGCVGDTARFTVKASGDGLTYQWQYKTATGTGWLKCSMEGNQTKTLSVPVTAARNGYRYRCVVTDGNGNKTISSPAKLTVAPKITSQPADRTASAGDTVKFTVKATGAGLTYQWQYKTATGTGWLNSTADGCGTAALSVKATAARNGQQYRCVVTDANGAKLISDPAVLTVN